MEKHQPHVRYTADEYDRYTAEFVKPFDEMMTKRVVEEARLQPPDALILDIGTGTARLLVHLAHIGELARLRLVGTDLFEDMITRARRSVAEAGLSGRIELIQQDVHAMDLPDEFADIILSRSTLHHWSDPTRALTEIYRVLKLGGVALIHDVRRDPDPEALAEFDRLRGLAGLGPSFLDEKFTAPEVEAFLRDAGLAAQGIVRAPSSGMGALGMEVEIRKPSLRALHEGETADV